MTNPYAPPSAPVLDQPIALRKRPWFVTAWLWLMIAANGFTAFSYFSFVGQLPEYVPEVLPVLLGVVAVANIVFLGALLLWKRWGVLGLLVTTAYVFAVNYWIHGLTSALLGLIGFVILIVLLNVGGKRRVWPKLSTGELEPENASEP